jgi:hypothetical protein
VSEPYYLLRVTSPFSDSSDTGSMRQEGRSNVGEMLVHVGMMSCSILIDQIVLGQSTEVQKIRKLNSRMVKLRLRESWVCMQG